MLPPCLIIILLLSLKSRETCGNVQAETHTQKRANAVIVSCLGSVANVCNTLICMTEMFGVFIRKSSRTNVTTNDKANP